MLTSEQREALESAINAMNRLGWTYRLPVIQAMLNASAAPAERRESMWVMADNEFCDLEAALHALELIASGKTYSKDHDIDGAMQKATIRDAMRHANNALRRFKPVFFKIADAWRDAKRPQARATAPTMSEAAQRVIDAARRMLGRGDTVVSPCFGNRAFISSSTDVEALSNALAEFDFAAAKGEGDAKS